MIEKLLEQEARHNKEFRERVDKKLSSIEERLSNIEKSNSKMDGKLALMISFISGTVSIIAKKLLG